MALDDDTTTPSEHGPADGGAGSTAATAVPMVALTAVPMVALTAVPMVARTVVPMVARTAVPMVALTVAQTARPEARTEHHHA